MPGYTTQGAPSPTASGQTAAFYTTREVPGATGFVTEQDVDLIVEQDLIEAGALATAEQIMEEIAGLPQDQLQLLANALAPLLPSGTGGGGSTNTASGGGTLGPISATSGVGVNVASGAPSLGAIQGAGTATNSGAPTDAMTIGGSELTVGGQPITV